MKYDLPDRKPQRLKGYNYNLSGAYFITVCVKNKEPVLGQIKESGVCSEPQMYLSDYGMILDRHIKQTGKRHPRLRVEKYVIMPTHFHCILSVSGADDADGNMSENKRACNNEVSEFVSLLKRRCDREYGRNIWQKSYNDHIIRGEADYREIWNYVDTNVLRWKKDRFCAE